MSAPEDTARLREELERVTRELEEETALRVGAIDRMKDAQRERDDAVKAVETARTTGVQSGLEIARHAYEAHDRTNRDWVKGSLWDKLNREAAARVAALTTETSK